MNRLRIINGIIEKFSDGTYIEIGVNMGGTFVKVAARRKIAVDPMWPRARLLFYLLRHRNATYCRMTSDSFFQKRAALLIDDGIAVAFVDGLHEYHQSLRDVENCLSCLRPGGVIVVHDCNPQNATKAMPLADRMARDGGRWRPGAWNGDVWKTVVYLRSHRDDLNVFVLDCDHGIGVITKGRPDKMLEYSKTRIESMTYAELECDRAAMLNLRDPEYFHQWLEAIN